MTLLINVSKLITEVEEFNTVERVFRYGVTRTLGLAIWRGFNSEILEFFQPILEKIDNAITYFDSTEFKASKYINRIDLGELVNRSKIKFDDSDKSVELFKIIYYEINLLILSLFKTYIDELFTAGISLNNITSVNSLMAVKYSGESKKFINEILNEYENILSKKPTSAINILSELKRQYIDSRFINEITSHLDSNLTKYIAKKLEINDKSSIIRNSKL